MPENAVQIVARFLGRDCKPCLVDDLLERGCRQLEFCRQLAFGDDREVIAREGLEIEAGAAGVDRHLSVGGRKAYLASLRKLPRDIEQGVSRNRCRARRFDLSFDAFVDLKIKVCCHQSYRTVRVRLDQHIRKDGDRVTAFDHRLDMAKALQKRSPFDGSLH